MSTEKSRSVDDAPFMDNERNIKIYDFEKAITAAGGFGRIQIYCLIICFASISGANFFTFTLSYLELMPKFQCLEQGNFVSCDSKDICNGEIIKSQDQWRIDWSDSESLHNWMTDMELYCTSNFEIGLIGSLFFLGFAICGVLVKLLDNYGRKPILIAGAATNIVITIVLYFVNNLYVRYIFLFVYGVTCAKILTTYMYVTEIGPAKSGVFCCGVVNCIEVVAIIPASLYFMFISNEWKYYYILAIVISVISFPFVFYLPESPKYLYEKGRHFELREVLRRIAETNKVKMDDNFIFENSAMKGQEDERSSKFLKTQSNEIDLETDLVSNVETFSVCNYLKNPAVTINLIVCCITFMAANFNYYMINFYMKYAGGNIYINIILLTISENIAYNTGSFIQSKFGTRKTFFFSYLSSIAFCIPLIFWDDVEWVIMVSVFLSRFGVAASFTLIYYVNQEIFPILFVPFSLSMCNFFARAIAIVAPQIAEIPKPFPVFSFIVIGGLALVSILFMRKIKDDKTKEHNHN